MISTFLMPSQTIMGEDALHSEEAKKALGAMGKKALIVTGPVMKKIGNAEKLTGILEELGISFEVFSDLPGEPDDEMVNKGVRKYLETGCDFLIGLGGGTPLDAMKAIGVLAVSGGSISDYLGKIIDVKMPPMAAIPTTAGTGSETTQFTIITDSKKNIKMLLKGKCLLPDLAIIDPLLTVTASPKVTAATGLDALCHCVEAYTSRKATAMTDTFAKSAVERIFRYLPVCFKDGSNLKAREQMALASFEAGVAFNNASVTLIHGMSRPIGALFHVAHGISNAMLMKECLTFALPGAYGRFGGLGRCIGAASASDDEKTAAEKFLAALVNMTKVLEIPTLEEYGIGRNEFFAAIDKMSNDAIASGSPANTLREVTVSDVKEIYRKLFGPSES